METRGIAEGMTVRAADGKKLGKVIECAEGSFVVEKGLFFPKDYSIRYDQVAEVREDEVYLNVADLDLGAESTDTMAANPSTTAVGGSLSGAGLGAAGTPAGPGAGAGLGAMNEGFRDESRRDFRGDEEVRVPLAEEQLEAMKVERQTGEVRVHKDVVTEQKQISVPVTREEVHVDRVPVSGTQAPSEAAFKDQTISVPVHEEEVEIRKRPVVKEEVRVGRTRRQEERRADAEVRREEARIEGGDDFTARDDVETRRDVEGTRDFDTRSDYPRSDIDDPERR
ncbi:MAG TPA: YsnF/AvaK domain-containing protein [Anaeromyxobacter sp.]|nr:YsnF/AvaK domain-containing protein [Anaeromyxobacter sp.]